MDSKKIISKLSLEEKAHLCIGKNFWMTKDYLEKGIRSLFLSDGPHGLRKQSIDNADHLGLNESQKSVCFPTGSAIASSWNRKTLFEVGKALGKAAKTNGIDMLLGPAINMKRTPLCGRNFEYYSEDPYLAGELGAAFVRGVQEQHVSACPKHFAANNQETRRKAINAAIDERTLREIYLPAFEKCIKEGKSKAIMTSYNKINGFYSSENNEVTNKILLKEWGFDGIVVSDWGAIDKIVDSIKTGLSLQMPGDDGSSAKKIIDAVKSGKLDESVLDKRIESLLSVIEFIDQKPMEKIDTEELHEIAIKAAEDSMVLLKNEKEILPLKSTDKIAIIGAMAKKPRYQGGGSSHVNPYRVSSAYTELQQDFSYPIPYADGYNGSETTFEEIEKCTAIAKSADKVLVFIGLPESYESEAYDRNSIELPDAYNKLVAAITEVNSNTCVILSNGSSITFPWKDSVPAIVETYLAGEASGEALRRLITGKTNFSGHLAETFIEKIEDSPSFLNFPGDGRTVEYKEGVFIGYRYYEKKKTKVLFPFGHGLSYTDFSYTDFNLSSDSITENETVTVSVTVKNTGNYDGKETVQLYIAPPESFYRPLKELKGFEKVLLKKGEKKTVSFTLDTRSFAYFEPAIHDWYIPSGKYTIMLGSSSETIYIRKTINIENQKPIVYAIGRNTLLADILADEELTKIFNLTYKRIKPYLPFGLDKGDLSLPLNQALLKNMTLNSLEGYVGKHLTDEDIDEISNMMNKNLEKRAILIK